MLAGIRVGMGVPAAPLPQVDGDLLVAAQLQPAALGDLLMGAGEDGGGLAGMAALLVPEGQLAVVVQPAEHKAQGADVRAGIGPAEALADQAKMPRRPTVVFPVWALASPAQARRKFPSQLQRMLPGLMSRWRMPSLS